jgi:hypothetical protein
VLNDIEKKILNDVFEMCINNGPVVSIINYDLIEKNNPEPRIRWNEFASYLLKLKSLGYLKFEDKKVLVTGGRTHPTYRNNICTGDPKFIDIDKNGIAFVIKERETLKDKVVEEIRHAGRSLYSQVRDGLIGFVAGIIVAKIIGLF